MAAKRKQKSSDAPTERKKKLFKFSEEMISSLKLAACLSDYKVKCDFSDIDFAADKVLQYKSMRSAMVAKHQDHKEQFGPAIAREDREDLTKEKRDSIQEYTKLITDNVYWRKSKKFGKNFQKLLLVGHVVGVEKLFMNILRS